MSERQEQINIGDIFNLVRENALGLIILYFILILLSVTYLIVATPKYKAELIVGPVAEENNSLAGGGLGKLIAGVGGNSSSGEYYLFQEMLTSRKLADRLAKNTPIMHILFSNYWDEKQEKWLKVYGLRSKVEDLFGLYRPYFPGGELVHQSLQDDLVVSETKGGAFLRITYEHEDADFAKKFISTLYSATDNILKEEKIARQNYLTKFLLLKIVSSDIPEQKQALADVYAKEEKTRILLESELPYAARIIDPPFVYDRIQSPNVFKVMFLTFLAGIIFSVLILIYKHKN